jgi:hypothetical protein
MRGETHAEKVQRLMEALGRAARGPGRVYLTGGATAVLIGWRDATVDVDLTMDPEPPGAFDAIARIKDQLDVNVELAAPSDFIPALPGWRERSVFIARHGAVDFYHYDFYAQALAKLERGHARDLADVRAMQARGLVAAPDLLRHYEHIERDLVRYPALDADAFRAKVEAFLAGEPHD